MKTSFQEEFMNAKLLEKIAKELRKNELNKTIQKIDFLYKQQKRIIAQYDIEIAKRHVDAENNL